MDAFDNHLNISAFSSEGHVVEVDCAVIFKRAKDRGDDCFLFGIAHSLLVLGEVGALGPGSEVIGIQELSDAPPLA